MITSLTNEFVKYLEKLKLKKYRDIENKFIVEGEHLVEEAINSNRCEKVIVVDGYDYNTDIEKIVVTEEIMKKISLLDTPSKVIGLCNILEDSIIGNKVLILDDIQDPGNLGTIIRSSLAFNVDTVILSNNTVDLYNPKVVRATQGMIFNINVKRCELISFINELKNNNYIIYTTDVNDGVEVKNIKKTNKWALIMGNEGNGVSKEVANLADKKININMNKNVESLNVGVATSIILYELEK